MNGDITIVVDVHCFELRRRHRHPVLAARYLPRRMPVPDIDAYHRFPLDILLSRIINPVILFVFIAEIHAPPVRYRPAAEIVTSESRRRPIVAKREIPPGAANGGMGIFGHGHVAARHSHRFGDMIVSRPDCHRQVLILVYVEQRVRIVHRRRRRSLGIAAKRRAMPGDHDTLGAGGHIVGVFLRPVELAPVETDGIRPVAPVVDVLRIIEHDIVHLVDIDGIIRRAESRVVCKFSLRIVFADDVLHRHVVVVVADQVEGLDRHASAFAHVDEIGQRRLVGIRPVRLLRHIAQIHPVNRHARRQPAHVFAQGFEIRPPERRRIEFALRRTNRRRRRRRRLYHRAVTDVHIGRHDHDMTVVVHLLKREIVLLDRLDTHGRSQPAIKTGDEAPRRLDLVTGRHGQINQIRLPGRRTQSVRTLFVGARHIHAVGYDDALHPRAAACYDAAHGSRRIDFRPVDFIAGSRGRRPGRFLLAVTRLRFSAARVEQRHGERHGKQYQQFSHLAIF